MYVFVFVGFFSECVFFCLCLSLNVCVIVYVIVFLCE